MRAVLFALGSLSDEDVDWLASAGQRRAVPAEKTLIQEGQPVDALFIILDGSCQVDIRAVDRAGVAVLGPGEIVGEVSFVDSRAPLATVTTKTAATLLVLPRELLEAKLAADVGFACRFYRAVAVFLAHRLRRLTLSNRLSSSPDWADDETPDDVADEALEQVALAGARYAWILRRLQTR